MLLCKQLGFSFSFFQKLTKYAKFVGQVNILKLSLISFFANFSQLMYHIKTHGQNHVPVPIINKPGVAGAVLQSPPRNTTSPH